MKKTWVNADMEVLGLEATAHGVEAPFVEDSNKWTCDATPDNPCEAGHCRPGIHGTWGSENASA